METADFVIATNAMTILCFAFDYGDHWEFKVRLEQIESGPCRLRRPEVIESAGKAPPQYPPIEE